LLKEAASDANIRFRRADLDQPTVIGEVFTGFQKYLYAKLMV